MFLGDDFHHNGAFRLSYGFEYVGHDGDWQRDELPISSSTGTTPIEWYLGLGRALERQRELLPRKDAHLERLRRPPELRRVLAEAGGDAVIWIRRKVPTLNVAGWWDQEDFYGPLKIYETLEKHDTNH